MLTAKQDNRLTTAETLLAALTKDPTVYANDKALQVVINRLKQIIADLLPLRQQAQRSTPGKAPSAPTGKEQARKQVALVAAEIAGDVFAYATDRKNANLQALADYSEGDFRNLRGSRLTDAATALYQVTQEAAYKTDLQTDYNITPARAKELSDAIKAFEDAKTKPREAVIDGKTARASLRAEFAELGELLEDRLMRLMRKYERSAPAFYARVVAARITIDRPGEATNGNKNNSANPA